VYRYSGVVRKQWWTAMDERVCPYCDALHGVTVDVEQNFLSLGDEFLPTGAERPLVIDYEDVGYPPAHPDCRCTVLPVVM